MFGFLKKKKTAPEPVSDKVTTEEPKLKIEFTCTEYDPSEYKCWEEGGLNLYTEEGEYVFLQALSYKARPIASDPDEYPRYLSYRHYIKDPIQLHKDYVENGYLRKANSRELVSAMPYNDLRNILKSQGLSNKGKKFELVDRLFSEGDITNIPLPDNYYVLSEKGLIVLNKHAGKFVLSTPE